jgi:hypothetical protein
MSLYALLQILSVTVFEKMPAATSLCRQQLDPTKPGNSNNWALLALTGNGSVHYKLLTSK